MDSITALAAATLMMIANGAVLAFMRTYLPPSLQPYAYTWQAATFSIAIGCTFFPFHAHIPLPLASVLANGPLLAGLAGYWHALRRFYGRPSIAGVMAMVIMVSLLGLLWFAGVHVDTKMRIMIVSAAWLVLMGGSFFTLLHGLRYDTTRSHWALLCIFGFVVLFTAVRAVYYLRLDIQPGFNIIDNSSFMNLLTPMVVVVLPIIGTTAFVLMLLERMRRETAASQADADDRRNLEQLSYIGHDLRAPLSTIVGYARLLTQTQTAEQADHLRAIERSANYQMQLIDEILEYAKRELRPLEMRLQPVRLANLLEDIVQHGKGLSSQRRNRFEFAASTPLPSEIRSDPRRLQQIILNLIANAAKFTQRGLIRLSVSARPDDAGQTTLVFTVTDTGAGIKPHDQQAIFKAFEQRGERPDGVGLGLYIARTAARNMKGDLILESSPGTGSSFCVYLPVQPLSAETVILPNQAWDADPAPPPGSASTPAPPPDMRLTLASLAANGQLSDIESWIETQARERPDYADFYDEVRQALQRLDFTHLEALAGTEGQGI